MTDEAKALVERLRIQAGIHYASKSIGILTKQQSMNAMSQAADRIEQLTAEVERLNEALRKCVMEAADWARQAGEAKGKLEGSEMPGIVDSWKAECERLRAALEGLMAIAEIAMPDTYFQTDSRVNAARAALGGKQ